jgi:hypothetical protein
MANPIRHLVGLIVGAVATPVILLLLIYGTDRLIRAFQIIDLESADRYVGALLIALAAAIVGVLVTPWVSPVGSLVPGLAFTGLGLLDLVSHETVADLADVFPDRASFSFLDLAAFGTFLLVGLVLVVASIPPSRWVVKRPGSSGPAVATPAPVPQYGPPPQQYGPPHPQAAPEPPAYPPRP